MVSEWSIFDRFLMVFRVSFSIKFHDFLNRSNGNTYNAKASFLHFRAPPFRINFPLEFHVFSGTAPSHHFVEKWTIWGPLQKSRGHQNGTQNQVGGAKVASEKFPRSSQKRKMVLEKASSWNGVLTRHHRNAYRFHFGSFLLPSRPNFEWFSKPLGTASCIHFWYQRGHTHRRICISKMSRISR